MPRMPDPEVRRRWRRLLDSFDPENETVVQFCENHDVSVASFYNWRRRLKAAIDRPALIPVDVVERQRSSVDLAPAVVIEIAGNTRIEVAPSHAQLATDIAIALAGLNQSRSTTSEVRP